MHIFWICLGSYCAGVVLMPIILGLGERFNIPLFQGLVGDTGEFFRAVFAWPLLIGLAFPMWCLVQVYKVARGR